MGSNAYDLAVRMKYARFDESKIKTFFEVKEAVGFIKEKTSGDVCAILNFDYIDSFNQHMRGEEK
jgi:hypothetical protein